MLFIISPIIVCLPERNGGLYPAAIYDGFEIYNPTNNGVFTKYRTNPHTIYIPKPPIQKQNLKIAFKLLSHT